MRGLDLVEIIVQFFLFAWYKYVLILSRKHACAKVVDKLKIIKKMNFPLFKPAPSPYNNPSTIDKDVYSVAKFVAKHPNSSASEIRKGLDGKLCAASRTTIYLYTVKCIKNKWIKKTGVTRSARYVSTPEFLHAETYKLLESPIMKREKMGYNIDFLLQYIPNETFYLSEKQRSELYRACPPGKFHVHAEGMEKELRRFVVDITHNSSAFEGVSVGYADTISLIDENATSRNMSVVDATILRNHYNTIRWILENLNYPRQPMDVGINEYDVCSTHSILSDGLLQDKNQQGCLRTNHVEIRDSAYIPSSNPETIKFAFGELVKKAAMIDDPYEQAVFLLVQLPYLQPFEDCNKRTARLICNIPLLSNGILPVSWTEVDQRAYAEALLCVYEGNATFGLCELFVDACKRSFERFDLSRKSREPLKIEVSHANEIIQAVRNRIINNDTTLPQSIDEKTKDEFNAVIESILNGIRGNKMVAIPYRIRPKELEKWAQSEGRVDVLLSGNF